MSDSTQPVVWLKLRQFAASSPLSESTVRRLVRQGKLPHQQPGGPNTAILIAADALDQCFNVHESEVLDQNVMEQSSPKRRPNWRKHIDQHFHNSTMGD